MNGRRAISAGELYAILEREFRMRTSAACRECYLTPPYRVDRTDENLPNWEVNLPPPCPQGCYAVLEALFERYGALYDLEDGAAET